MLSERNFTEKDWKLFRKKLPQWQENYMERLNKEYIDLLNGSGSPSEKFWALEKRICRDKKRKGVMMEMSRSKLILTLTELLEEGAITGADLDEFSNDLKETLSFFVGDTIFHNNEF